MSNMVVRTNVFAINSHRNLKNVGHSQRKSAQRLSSGFRVNSAADDAAGLAISETMRAQIRGLDQASINSQDAVGLVQTAEGAMATVSDMIIRMRELMVQAANDTNTFDNREMIQLEIDQIMTEINDVTFRTQFNTRTLLAGGLSGEGGGRTSPVSLQWMIFEQVRVIGLPHPGGTVGPTGRHPNPNNKNETSLRHEIIELQTELIALARRVGERLVASGEMSRTDLNDMFNGFPHDFTEIIAHMQQSEMQQMRSIESRLENRLRTALRTAEEIYQITQDQVNALGGMGAINGDGSNVFSQQALAEWSDDARERLNEIRDSITGPSTLSRYPQGYLNRLAEIDDIASLYDIIGYLVGWPGIIPNPNFQPPPPYMDNPYWVRPNRHENPLWRAFQDNPDMIDNPNPQPFVIDPNYRWNFEQGGWFQIAYPYEQWFDVLGSAGHLEWGPLIPDPNWTAQVPDQNPHQRWNRCEEPNPPADGDPCSCGEATCEPDPQVSHPQVPNDTRVPAPSYIYDPNWQRPIIRIPNYIPNEPDWSNWLNTPGNFVYSSPTPPSWIPDRSFIWSPDRGEWVDRVGNRHPNCSGNPNDGPLVFRPGNPDGVRRPAPGLTHPPQFVSDGYNEFLDWSATHPRIPNTRYVVVGNDGSLRPVIRMYSGRTLNNLEMLQGLSLDALGTVNLEANAMWFQIGANALQGTVLQLKGIHTGILGGGRGDLTTLIDVRERSGIPISEQLDIIDLAEGIVNAQRAQLGAVQNRLEFTRQSLDISSENLSAAESRIRDTDMALEMMRFTAAQVLQQAGVSMLAQANQLPASILQLLQ
ncbi:MAG: hypothetical protein FWF80_04320 [Defluviitaleaceae bacterium]|nr:hypothetical protein [Defluviitaleaceae bacterium]